MNVDDKKKIISALFTALNAWQPKKWYRQILKQWLIEQLADEAEELEREKE